MERGDYQPIADYGLIGNCRSAALVGVDGSIDWCCFPRFDAPSVFAALLDAKKGGRFAITPRGPYSVTQRYAGDTNVLETRFETETGVCTLTDGMPLYLADDGAPVEFHQIIRVLRCEVGTIALHVRYEPRPDYARAPVGLVAHGEHVRWDWGGRRLTLESPVVLETAAGSAQGVLALREGEEATFVLSYRDGTTHETRDDLTPQQRLERTLAFWEHKVAQIVFDGPWRQQVVRSYLALHLLTYLPTGAIVAAPTTSLPEEIRGVRNWDYRYTWMRDAAFTIEALMALGDFEEATAFFRFLCQVCTDCAEREHLPIMFRVDGGTELEEESLPHLEGYRGSPPVRIGNGAYSQVQHDVYGELLTSAHLLFGRGAPISDVEWPLLRMLANLASSRWQEPDRGIWEVRGEDQHFVYSKVMCWVALDRAVALAQATGHSGQESESWRRTAEAIKADVLSRGWSAQQQAFIQHYATQALDASLLLLPLVGFLPANDPRMVATVRRIQEGLGEGPFLRRYRLAETDDGVPGAEGAFTLCSFWLARALARIGEVEEARRLVEEVLRYANHLGLFSEMVDPRTGEALGNFPQAFTHIGLILAAKECGFDHEDAASLSGVEVGL